jgi:hypothetical protein
MLNANDPICRVPNPSTAHCSSLPSVSCAPATSQPACEQRIYREVKIWPDGNVPSWTGTTTTSSEWCYFEAGCVWVPGQGCRAPEKPAVADPGIPNSGYHWGLKTVVGEVNCIDLPWPW